MYELFLCFLILNLILGDYIKLMYILFKLFILIYLMIVIIFLIEIVKVLLIWLFVSDELG